MLVPDERNIIVDVTYVVGWSRAKWGGQCSTPFVFPTRARVWPEERAKGRIEDPDIAVVNEVRL